MSRLIATNVRIPEKDYIFYKALASDRGMSFAEFVRKALAEKTKWKIKKSKKTDYSLWDLGTKYTMKGGDPRASRTIDKVVYSNPHGCSDSDE